MHASISTMFPAPPSPATMSEALDMWFLLGC
jgi:hypothetical protein